MRKLTKFLCPKCFDGVYGDGMTAMRVKSSKAWRQTERTQVDRFDFSSPGFGLFHAVWDLMRDLLQAFWATLVVSGASQLNTFLQAHVGQDAKKFNLGDDFLLECGMASSS